MSRKSVLIIEDDVSLGQALQEVLGEWDDFAVEVITDGQLGLERLAAAPVDVVILDLHLPHVSGLEILQQMRANTNWDGTKVVVSSADALRIAATEGLADFVLLKPFGIDRLLQLLDDIA